MNSVKQVEVCLVMPPFAEDIYPSLGLSLLKACLLREGISCTVDYADIRYLNRLGLHRARGLLSLALFFGAEAVFAPLAGIRPRRGLAELAEGIARERSSASASDILRLLRESREAVGRWLEETVSRILSMEPRFVGVCSMFQQRNAALAILRRLKEETPGIVTALGGANCMGSAGGRMLRAFPFVDYVFFGEADEIFAEVVRGALSSKNFPLPYGVLRQGDGLPPEGRWPHRLTEDLESLPLPDYGDFFSSREFALPETLGDRKRLKAHLHKDGSILLGLEGSRGCWWGEKRPCTFCGLNGKAKRYRRKSPERLAREIKELRERYGDYAIFLSDSILSREAQKELPRLMEHFPRGFRRGDTPTEETPGPSLFAETKSNLTEEEVRELAEIGFLTLQPGIESLSDHVLQLMGKGNTAIRHLALLKYARRYRVHLVWNLLHGFPGERAEDYEEMLRFLPLITHLQPPNGFLPILYHRNSVYANRPEAYGLKLVPSEWYDFMAPDDDAYIADIAYVYTDLAHPPGTSPLAPVYGKAEQLVEEWKRLAAGEAFADRLEMREGAERTEITDLRKCRAASSHVLTGLAQRVYALCRAPISLAKLAESLKVPEREVADALADLEGKRLLVGIGGEYLALAVDSPLSSTRTAGTNINKQQLPQEAKPQQKPL